MDDVTQAIRDIPWTGLIPVILVLIGGITLWAAGRSVLRATFAVLGLLLGGLAGWMLGDSVDLGVPTIVVAAVAALLAAGIAVVAYRFAIALAMAATLAVAAPTLVWAVAAFSPEAATSIEETSDKLKSRSDELTEWLEAKKQQATDSITDAAASEAAEQFKNRIASDEAASEHMETLRTAAEQVRIAAASIWEKTPERLRPALIGAAIVGGLVGFLVGFLIQSFSASVVTSMGGSLIILSAGSILARKVELPESIAGLLPASPQSWAIAWAVLAVIGLAIQWGTRRKPADTTG